MSNLEKNIDEVRKQLEEAERQKKEIREEAQLAREQEQKMAKELDLARSPERRQYSESNQEELRRIITEKLEESYKKQREEMIQTYKRA